MCTHITPYTNAHACKHTHTRTHTHAHRHTHACTHTRARALTHMHTHSHTHTYAQAHTRMYQCCQVKLSKNPEYHVTGMPMYAGLNHSSSS